MGIYISSKVKPLCSVKLYTRLKLMGVDNLNDPSKYHNTIAYSRNNFDTKKLMKSRPTYTAFINGWNIFKINHREKNPPLCLVALITCPDFVQLHNHCNSLGASYDFETYEPHITVSYNYVNKINLETLPVNCELIFSEYTIEPLEQ